MPEIIKNKMIEEFKDRASFTREELFDFFRQFEPDLKEGTLAWRIYDLKNKDIIKPLMRGLYSVSDKTKYSPAISQELYKIADQINTRYADIKYCLWETEWLNEFSQHQSGKKMILVEVEKDFVESFYYELKDNFKYDIYLNPDEKTINFYVSESNRPVVLKNLITRSPIDKQTEGKVEIYTPLLEKILVDLFAEEKLFYPYQGGELIHIFGNALQAYAINFTKLFSYAKRREKEIEIKTFLTNNIPHLVKDIIHD